VGKYQWTPVMFEAQNKIVHQIPVAEMCCNPELSASGKRFELADFVRGTAGAPWENSVQTIQYIVTSLSNRPVAENVALSPSGMLEFDVVQDIYGSSEFEIEIRDSNDNHATKTLTIQVLKRNQGPQMQVHHEFHVFQNSGHMVLQNAVYNINPGRAFEIMQFSAGPPAVSFQNCLYTPDPQDHESEQTIVSASVSVDRPGLFALEEGGFPRLVLNGSCASLEFVTSKSEFGTTRMALTAKDSEGIVRSKMVVFNVLPVDSSPTFKLQAKVTVSEDDNCRKTFKLYSDNVEKINANWVAPSGCPFEFSNFATELRAGEFLDEMCTNCPASPPCVDPTNCKQQQLTFVLDDVSEPLLFHSLPSIDMHGRLRFALQPDASGVARVVFRLNDDGIVWNSQGHAWTATSTACSEHDTLPCGPGTQPGRTLAERGTNTSKHREFLIDVVAANDVPSFAFNRKLECLSPHTDFVGPGGCICPSPAAGMFQDNICSMLSKKDLEAGLLPSVKVFEDAGPQNVLHFVPEIGVSDAVHARMSIFEFDRVSGNLTFDSTRKDPILGAAGLEMATAFAVSPDQAHVYTADFASNTLSVLDHARGDAKMRFLDRHGHGEARVTLEHFQTIATNNPCKMAVKNNLLAVASGCEDIGRVKEVLDSEFLGDVMGLTQSNYKYGSAWKNTVGFWQLSSNSFTGRRTRKSIYNTFINCYEIYDTDYSPAMVIDSAGNFPPASLQGAREDRYFACKQNTETDVPIGRQPSLFTYAANDGTNEALQFDNSNNNGLWVTTDLDSILHLMPKTNLSMEMWFTIAAAPEVDAGLISATNEKGGWLLSYSFGVPCSFGITPAQCNSDALNLNWKVFTGDIVKGDFTSLRCDTILNFKKNDWSHVVTLYDGHHARVYFNGQLIGEKEVCADTLCPITYPECGYNGVGCTKGPFKIPASFVIGAYELTSLHQGHIGMIKSVRLYNMTLSSGLIMAAYNTGKASGLGIVTSNYWVKSPTDTLMIPSPGDRDQKFFLTSTNTSDVQQNITMMGRFSPSRKYRVRWSIPGYYVETDDCVIQNAMSLDGRETCSMLANPDTEQTKCQGQLYCCDDATKNQLHCTFPDWYQGYKAAVMTVIESDVVTADQTEGCGIKCGTQSDFLYKDLPGGKCGLSLTDCYIESEKWQLEVCKGQCEGAIAWGGEILSLWQRVCMDSSCGFLPTTKILTVSSVLSKVETLWWLSGKMRSLEDASTVVMACASGSTVKVGCTLRDPAVLRWNIIDPKNYAWYANRGDKAHFLWRAPSFYTSFDEIEAKFDTTVNNLDFALGASAFKIFTSVTNKEYIAVANFWDGLSSQTLSCIAEFKPETKQFGIVQILPTRSATSWDHFQLSSSGGNLQDYLVLSSYAGNSSILRFDTDARSIASLSLVTPGKGYLPGIVKILENEGVDFRALFSAYEITIRTSATPVLQASSNGGDLHCTEPFTCMKIVSGGKNFGTIPFASLAQSQLQHLDSDCTEACNPYLMEPNCSRVQPEKCFQGTAVGNVEVFYTNGCAREDSECENVVMSNSITKLHLSPVTVLPGKNTQVAPTKIGHTNNCFRSGILKDAAALKPDRERARMVYEANTVGQIYEMYFPYATAHGQNYASLPGLIGSDALCRCGTTVTELEILDPGEEYSSGYLDVSGPGSQFSATYDVRGNVSQTVLLAAGGGFSAMPKIKVLVDSKYESGGLNASAVALLGVKNIIVVRKGTQYSQPPLIEISAPTFKYGVRATARVILAQKPVGVNVSYIDSIEVLNAGLGYASVPDIKIIEDPLETRRHLDVNGSLDVNNTLGVVDAVAIPVLEVKEVVSNHEYEFDKLSWSHQNEQLQRIVQANREEWFDTKQNSMYEMPLSADKSRIVGIEMAIEMQHFDSTVANSTMSETMEFFCDDCLFVPIEESSEPVSPTEYINQYLATEDTYAKAGLSLSNSPYLRSVPPFDPNRTNPVILNFTLFEPFCIDLCLKIPECVGIDIGKDFDVQGQCWIHANKSKDPDGLWRNETASRSFKGNNSKGCVDSTWQDAFGRNCTELEIQGLCPVNTTFVNLNWTVVMKNRNPNSSMPYKISPAMSFTGDELRDTACNSTNCTGYMTGYEACCACGKIGPGFRAYFKQHTQITMHLKSAIDLLCRPSKSTGLPSDAGECTFPFKNVSIRTDRYTFQDRCCYDAGSQVVYVSLVTMPEASDLNANPQVSWSMLLQEIRYDSWVNWTNTSTNITSRNTSVFYRNSSSEFLRNDSLILKGIGTPKHKIGLKGQMLYASISAETIVPEPAEMSAMPMLAASRPIVTGKIVRFKQTKRGTNYTNSDNIFIFPLERPDYHNASALSDDQYRFEHAIIRHAIGFSGVVPGSFDGSNIDAMCSPANSASGLCSRTAPYGQGFGPCVTMTRASGVQLLASTSGADLKNSTRIEVEGATDVDAFKIEGEQYLVFSSYFNQTEFRRLLKGVPPQDPFSFTYPLEVLDTAHRTESPMFRVDLGQDGHPQLHRVQQFDTYAAYDVDSYVFNGTRYLIFANERGPISPVFSWSQIKKQFVLIQRMPTFAARSISTFEKVVNGEAALFGLLAQSGEAQQCPLDDQLTDTPFCGERANRALYESYDLAGIRGFGPVLTRQSEQGRSIMLRWNGSMWQDVPNPKTLSEHLAGGQAFFPTNVSSFVKVKSQFNEFAVLTSSENPNECRDSNVLYCDYIGNNSFCQRDSNGLFTFAYFCDACPKTCGTCDLCNQQYRNMLSGVCEDSTNLLAVSSYLGDSTKIAGIEPMDPDYPQCADWVTSTGDCTPQIDNCLLCPKTCNLCGLCTLENIRTAGATYGKTRKVDNTIMIAKTKPYLPLQGIDSVVVSPDGRHVYAGAYYSRSVVAFARAPSTGLLEYMPDLGSRGSYSVDDFEHDRVRPFVVCEHEYDCSELGFGRPYQGLSQLIMSDDGNFMYSTNFLGNSVTVMKRDTSGALTIIQTIKNRHLLGNRFVDGLAGASSIFLSYDLTSVYVTGYTDQSLVLFNREPGTGLLNYIDRVKNGERRFEKFVVSVDNAPQKAEVPNSDSGYPKQLDSGASRTAEYFIVDGKQYLAIAVDISLDAKAPEPEETSYIDVFIWSHEERSFNRVHRRIIAHGVVDIESTFVVDDDGKGAHYLIVSFFENTGMWSPASDVTAGVKVYHWNSAKQDLIFHHQLPQFHPDGEKMFSTLMVPSGVHAFIVGKQRFLAVAYHRCITASVARPYNVPSYIYIWNSDGQRLMEDGTLVSGVGFEAFQRIVSIGATGFTHLATPCTEERENAVGNQCVGGSVYFLAMSAFGSDSDDQVSNMVDQVSNMVWRFQPNSGNFDPDNRGLWNNVGTPGYFEKVFSYPATRATSVVGFNIQEIGHFIGWTQRQQVFDATAAVSGLDSFSAHVTLWRLNATLSTTCTMAAGNCFSLYQMIDGVTVESNESSAIPGKTVLDVYEETEESSIGMRGATGLTFFEAHGERYLGIAQSMCPMYGGAKSCEVASVRDPGTKILIQPKSSILQWNRALKRFTELLSITDNENLLLRGERVSEAELKLHPEFHSFALRLPLGIAMGLESFEVRTSQAIHNVSLLVVSSMSKGTIIYNWDFDVIRGLNGTTAVTALMPMLSFNESSSGGENLPKKEYKTKKNGEPGELEIEALYSVPFRVRSTGWVPNTTARELNVDSVYTYAELDKSVVHSRPISRVDHVGNFVSRLTVERRWTIAATKEAGAGDDTSTHVVEGLSGPSYMRVLNVPVLYDSNSSEHLRKFGFSRKSGSLVYDQRLAVVSRGLSTERMCGFLSHGPCQTVSMRITQIEGHLSIFTETPEINPDGHLRFTSRPHAVGTAKFRLEAVDAGFPSRLDDIKVSPAQYFQIEVVPVNDQPQFDPINVVTGMASEEDEYNLEHLVFAVNVTPGVSLRYSELGMLEEMGKMKFHFTYQTIPLKPDVGGQEIFVHTPELNVSVVDDKIAGILTFKTTPWWFGKVVFDVVLDDNGEKDAANASTGAEHRSEVKTFNLTIAYRNTKPKIALKDSVYALMGRTGNYPDFPGIVNAKEIPGGTLMHMVFPFKANPALEVCSVPTCCGNADGCIPAEGMNICIDRTEYPECEDKNGLTEPYCLSTGACPREEAGQKLKFEIVKGKKLSGNFKGTDEEILNNGGGLFLPPNFIGTCAPENLMDSKMYYLQLWNKTGGTQNTLRVMHLEPLNVTFSKQASKSRSPSIVIDDVNALENEQQRLISEFCRPCYDMFSRCLGQCMNSRCHTECNDDVDNGGNCDGKCIKPGCTGKLDVFSPHFTNSNITGIGVGWDQDFKTLNFGMTFAPMPDTYGEVELTVVATDDGGRQFRGQDTAYGIFVLKLVQVNEGPKFVAHRLRLLESSTSFLHTFPGMVTASNGIREDQDHSFVMTHIYDDSSLFQTLPTISQRGTLAFILRPFSSGSARITVIAVDDGGVDFYGEYNTTCHVDINVLPVNVRPTFNIPSTVLLVEDSPVIAPLFTKNMSKGSTNEYWQTLHFQMLAAKGIPPHDAFRLFDGRECSMPSQCKEDRCVGTYWSSEDFEMATLNDSMVHYSGFEVDACNGSHPQIDFDGQLTLKPARDQHGVAVYKVVVQDDGGTAYGGHDTFSAQLILKVLPQPRVWGVSPRFGPASGNNLVTIRGQYFGSTYSRGYVSDAYNFTSVSIGGVECLEHKFLTDSEISCRPAPAVGSGGIVVQIDDPGQKGDPFVSTSERTGVLEARQGYRHVLFAIGGSERAKDPTDIVHGLLGLGPSVHRSGSTTIPASSKDPMELLMPSAITAIAVDRGLVYAGGSFATVTVPESGKLDLTTVTVNRILRYDGNQVSPLGAGTNGEINVIVAFQGLLAIGGAFTEVYPYRGSAIPTGGVALWNPAEAKWSNLGGLPTDTFSGVVMALAAKGDVLVIGGKFDRFSPSTKDMHGLAMYIGISERWVPMGDGVSGGHVLSLLLHCSGSQDAPPANGTSANGTNGTCSSDSGACNTPGNATGTSLAPCGALESLHVYVGGTFSKAGKKTAKGIAMWDGSQWHSPGQLNGQVHSFSYLAGWLYVGGTFTEIQYGQIETPYGKHLDIEHLARYRNGEWEPVGSGVGGPVYTLQSIRGCVYVGGYFDRVCKSETVAATRAHRCAQETDPGNFLTVNSLARMCYGIDAANAASSPEWEAVTTHRRHALENFVKVRALASFDESH